MLGEKQELKIGNQKFSWGKDGKGSVEKVDVPDEEKQMNKPNNIDPTPAKEPEKATPEGQADEDLEIEVHSDNHSHMAPESARINGELTDDQRHRNEAHEAKRESVIKEWIENEKDSGSKVEGY